MEKNLIHRLSNPQELAKFLQAPSVAIAEVLSGYLASEKNEKKLMAGKLVQGLLKWKLFTQLGREITDLREKGRIKEDYLATHQQQVNLIELLRFIDEGAPDEEIFSAIKSIFYTSISTDASAKDESIAHHYLQVCKKLGSGDLLVLKECYTYSRSSNFEIINSIDQWRNVLSKIMGLRPEMIELFEEKLVRLKLLSKPYHPDGSGIQVNTRKDFRLTGFAVDLYEFVLAAPKVGESTEPNKNKQL